MPSKPRSAPRPRDPDAAIEFEHLTGARTDGADSVDAFPPDIRHIRIARGGGDVATDPADRRVSSRHAHVDRDDLGYYKVTPESGRFVAVNGAAIDGPHALRTGDEIRLGETRGYGLRVAIAPRSAINANAATITQQVVKPVRQVIRDHARVAALAALVLAVAVAATIGLVMQDRRDHRMMIAQLVDGQEQMTADLADVAQARSQGAFDEAFVDRLRANAYLVTVRERNGVLVPKATAWPVSPTQLLTNAHVVDALDGEEIVVVQPETGAQWPIVGQTAHPGYAQFRDWLDESKPGIRTPKGEFARLRTIAAYDVATLTVDDATPLLDHLQLADAETVRALKPGDQLAFAGYPLENAIGSQSQVPRPSPTLQFGHVTALTNFLFGVSDDGTDHKLVHHSLPAEGGTSGSPIVNSDGKVVAILSGGNTVFVADAQGNERRIANPVLVNFGQRIDTVADLLSAAEGAGSMSAGDQRVARWNAQAEAFDDRFEVLKAQLTKAGERLYRSSQTDRTQDSFVVSPEDTDAGLFTRAHSWDIDADEQIGLMIYAEDGQRLSILLAFDDEPLSLGTEQDHVRIDRRVGDEDFELVHLRANEAGTLTAVVRARADDDESTYHVIAERFPSN